MVDVPAEEAESIGLAPGPTRPIAPSPLPTQIAAYLRDRIIHDVLKPGERIREQGLADLLSVSRTPLRDALKILQIEGLINLHLNRGATVVAQDEFSLADVRRVCAALEALAGAIVADEGNEGSAKELQRLLKALQKAVTDGDPAAYFRSEQRLYREIVLRSQSKTIFDLHERLSLLLYRRQYLATVSLQMTSGLLSTHHDVMKAIADRDPFRVRQLILNRGRGPAQGSPSSRAPEADQTASARAAEDAAAVTPLAADAAAQLRNMIIHNELVPGARIQERHFANVLNISRTPLRDAIKILDREGLIELTPNHGARVVDFSPAEIRDMLLVYSELDGLAGRIACERATEKDLDNVGERLALLEQAAARRDPRAYFKANQEFHLAIVAAAKNETLQATHRMLNLRLYRTRYLAILNARDWSELSALEHTRLFKALRQRNGDEMERLAKQHLALAWRFVDRTLIVLNA